MNTSDCIIVGGGIGGAVLALSLARRKHAVTILEKETALPQIARPEILAQSTLAVFDELGAGARIRREAALPLEGLRLWQKGERLLLAVSREEFNEAGVLPHSTDPVRTRQILLEEAAKTGLVDVRRGVEVTGLIRQEGAIAGVQAREQSGESVFHSRLIVGDDGGHSRIRQALGIALPISPLAVDFLAIKTAVVGDKEKAGQAWLNPFALGKGLAGAVKMPLPGDRAACVFILSEKAFEAFRRLPEGFMRSASGLIPQAQAIFQQNRFPEEFIHIKRPFGHAVRYVADGAALLGDAAHPVTPAGGQGANMSVADATVLAEVAHQALLKNDLSTQRLGAYELARRQANERSLSISVGADRVIRFGQLFPWLSGLIPWFIHRQDSREGKQRLLRGLSQAFVASRN